MGGLLFLVVSLICLIVGSHSYKYGKTYMIIVGSCSKEHGLFCYLQRKMFMAPSLMKWISGIGSVLKVSKEYYLKEIIL